MNIFIITLTIGWLIITSNSKSYKYVRFTAALLAFMGVLGLIFEHIESKSAMMSKLVAFNSSYIHWMILSLAALTLFTELFRNRSSFSHTRAW